MPVDEAVVNLILVLFLIPIMGFAAVWIIHKMVTGDLSFFPGLATFACLILLFAVAVLVPGQKMAIPVIVVVVMAMVFYPFAETQIEKMELERIDYSRIDRAHRELSVRPNNVAARFELASALYDRGMAGTAIVLAEDAINGLSTEQDLMSMQSLRDKFRTEEYMLKKWKRESGIGTEVFQPISCPKCQFANPVGTLECQHCHCAYILELARSRDTNKPMIGKLILGFGLTTLLLVGSAWIGQAWPWPKNVMGIGVALLGAGVVMAWLFRPRALSSPH